MPSPPQPTPPRHASHLPRQSKTRHYDVPISSSESDDDDEDDGQGTAAQAARLREELPSNFFRAPTSSEKSSRTYSAIQSELEEYLDGQYEEFSICVLVACRGRPSSIVEFPFLLIAVSKRETTPAITSLPTSVRESGLGVVVCHVKTDFGLSENTSRTLPRPQLVTGLAVGSEENKGLTTLGCMVCKKDGSGYIAVTSGHLVDKGKVGSIITQPSMEHFVAELGDLRERVSEYAADIERAKSSAVRDRLSIAQGKVEQQIKSVEQFIGRSDDETWLKLKAGTLTKRELTTEKFGGVRRIVDYLMFNVDEKRVPGGDLWEFAKPAEGLLRKGAWATLRDWGSLEFDDAVRKNGAATGYSFGVVAGVTTSLKLIDKRRTREFFIMRETEFETNPFAKPGDSGSAIINRKGELVGFVTAQSILDDFKVLLNPQTGHLDLSSMKKYINAEDGSVDYEKAFFREFSNINLTLAMCSSVLEARTGIQGMGELDIDT
jgi:hypothetical protein